MLLPSVDKRRFFLRRNELLEESVGEEGSSRSSVSALFRFRLCRVHLPAARPPVEFGSFDDDAEGAEFEDDDDDSSVADADHLDPMFSRFNKYWYCRSCNSLLFSPLVACFLGQARFQGQVSGFEL